MKIMIGKIRLIIFILLFSWMPLNAAIPALSSTPVEEAKPKLKNKSIRDIVIESKVYFLDNPQLATAARIYDIIDSILEDPLLAKKIAQAKNPSDNFDLFFSMQEALQTVINNQSYLPNNWVNLTSVQKLRRTLTYLLAIYPESTNLKDLFSYSPKSLNLKESVNKKNEDESNLDKKDDPNNQKINNSSI
jgi:hypothetical protein